MLGLTCIYRDRDKDREFKLIHLVLNKLKVIML